MAGQLAIGQSMHIGSNQFHFMHLSTRTYLAIKGHQQVFFLLLACKQTCDHITDCVKVALKSAAPNHYGTKSAAPNHYGTKSAAPNHYGTESKLLGDASLCKGPVQKRHDHSDVYQLQAVDGIQLLAVDGILGR